MKKIDAGHKIGDLLREHPGAKKVLAGHGMMCAGCGGSDAETIRQAAQTHGVPLALLMDELKAAAKPGS